MILDHRPGIGLALGDADDFKGFKLRLRAAAGARPDLPGIAYVDDDNVLVDPGLVGALPGAPETDAWREGFGRMVDYAATKGWVDERTGAIRAHVERIP